MGEVLERSLAKERREPAAEIVELEKREARLWFRWQELDQRTKELVDSGNSELLKLTRKDAVRAHRDHQRCVDLILRMHRDRLFQNIRES